jgi:hypothetical protein
MKNPRHLILACVLAVTAAAAPLQDNIRIDALVVTKAELRRHMAAPEDDRLRPATYADLEASRGAAQPDYLVVRFLTSAPGHYSGEAEAKIDGNKHGTKLNVALHFNKGWVEYFIPLDGLGWRSHERVGAEIQLRAGTPGVVVIWNHLETK